MKDFLRAFIGLLLISFCQVPKLVYRGLLTSYAHVFNRHENLTASPIKHIKHAKRLLKKDNAYLLYAALELRLAIERMADYEATFIPDVSQNILKKPSAVKKTSYMRKKNGDTAYSHKIVMGIKKNDFKFELGKYKPIDVDKLKEIEGRLGNLLHAQHGIPYGVSYDPWYIETRKFLTEIWII